MPAKVQMPNAKGVQSTSPSQPMSPMSPIDDSSFLDACPFRYASAHRCLRQLLAEPSKLDYSGRLNLLRFRVVMLATWDNIVGPKIEQVSLKRGHIVHVSGRC